jgi:hypothetical protein
MLVANFEAMVKEIRVAMVVVARAKTKYALMINAYRIEGAARLKMIVEKTRFV